MVDIGKSIREGAGLLRGSKYGVAGAHWRGYKKREESKRGTSIRERVAKNKEAYAKDEREAYKKGYRKVNGKWVVRSSSAWKDHKKRSRAASQLQRESAGEKNLTGVKPKVKKSKTNQKAAKRRAAAAVRKRNPGLTRKESRQRAKKIVAKRGKR